MSRLLAPLAARARRVRELYAKLETQRNGRPWTRAELAQGFVGDVGDLMKLLMAKEGIRPAAQLDARLRHEFGDCLWCLFVLADAHHVDLEDAFQHTMDYLEAQLKTRTVVAKPGAAKKRKRPASRG
jgi:NTP pyrophosphatase (non-canonical NTP hydrolase)